MPFKAEIFVRLFRVDFFAVGLAQFEVAIADVEGESVRLVVELQVLFVGSGAVHAADFFAVLRPVRGGCG